MNMREYVDQTILMMVREDVGGGHFFFSWRGIFLEEDGCFPFLSFNLLLIFLY